MVLNYLDIFDFGKQNIYVISRMSNDQFLNSMSVYQDKSDHQPSRQCRPPTSTVCFHLKGRIYSWPPIHIQSTKRSTPPHHIRPRPHIEDRDIGHQIQITTSSKVHFQTTGCLILVKGIAI
jgi:hypothetical protein